MADRMESDPAETLTREEVQVKAEKDEVNPSTENENPTPVAEADKKPEESAKKPPSDPAMLDLAFAMDCTGSMGSYIHQAQQNIRTIVEEIVAKEGADIRLALVEYRDHPPQDKSFVTKVHDFTPSIKQMKTWLDGCSASGGGDGPEAVADALHQVLKLSWRDESTKICVFIADAPPHGLGGGGDGFPNGCPDGLDPMQTTNELAEKGITMYMVGCEPSIRPYKDFFMALAHITGGQYVPLVNAKLLANVIVGGAQEEIALQQLMQEVNQEVIQEAAAAEELDTEVLSRRVQEKLNLKGMKGKKLRRNQESLPTASVSARAYSECASMGDLRSKYKSAEPEPAPRGSGSRMRMSKKSAPRARSSASPGLFSSLKSAVFGSSEAAPEAVADSMASLDDGFDCMPESMSAGRPSSGADMYEVAEDEDIDYSQASRMVQKSIMSNKLKSKVKKF